MPRQDDIEKKVTPHFQIAYAACTGFVIGWCLAYVLCDALGWPRLAYEPYGGELSLASGHPPPTVMTYWGVILWGVIGGVVGAALGAVGARLARRAMSDRVITLLGAWAVTAFVIAGLYYLWNLWPF